MAGGSGGHEQVDYMENHWSQVLIVLSPPTHTVHLDTAINLSSPPELSRLENKTTQED